jgi:hypothetical protein
MLRDPQINDLGREKKGLGEKTLAQKSHASCVTSNFNIRGWLGIRNTGMAGKDTPHGDAFIVWIFEATR